MCKTENVWKWEKTCSKLLVRNFCWWTNFTEVWYLNVKLDGETFLFEWFFFLFTRSFARNRQFSVFTSDFSLHSKEYKSLTVRARTKTVLKSLGIPLMYAGRVSMECRVAGIVLLHKGKWEPKNCWKSWGISLLRWGGKYGLKFW